MRRAIESGGGSGGSASRWNQRASTSSSSSIVRSPAVHSAVNATISERIRIRPEGLQEACECLPVDMRLPLFAHCVDIVLADGLLLPIEMDLLNRIMTFLAIDPAEGKRVLEVMLIQNRF